MAEITFFKNNSNVTNDRKIDNMISWYGGPFQWYLQHKIHIMNKWEVQSAMWLVLQYM